MLELTTRPKEQQQVWKRILIIDDDADITLTFKTGIGDYNNNNNAMLTKKLMCIHLIILL